MPAVLWKINGRPEGARPALWKTGGEGALRALNPLVMARAGLTPEAPCLGQPPGDPGPSRLRRRSWAGRSPDGWRGFSRAE